MGKFSPLKKENRLIFFLIFSFLFLNSLPFFVGSFFTPKGKVFLGTVHWPQDYFYYLSLFNLGKENFFLGQDLYTTEEVPPNLVGWVNVFLGKIFSFWGIEAILAYQLCLLLFAFTFLFFSFLFLKEVFPESKEKRLTAFLLTLFSSPFPRVLWENGRLSLSYFDYWYNSALPFNRLGGVPHHLLGRSCLVFVFLLVLKIWQGKKIPSFLFLLLGFLLASVEPVHWVLAVGVLLFPPLFFWVRGRFFWKKQGEEKPVSFFPGIFFLFGGLPMALYLKSIFLHLPYSQLALWEEAQQVSLSFLSFLLATGPVFLLGILGMLLAKGKRRKEFWLAVFFPLLSTFLFFSPLPKFFHLTNVRFLPAVNFLFLAILATEFLFFLADFFPRQKKAVRRFFLFLILFLSFPAFFQQLKSRISFPSESSLFFLPREAFAAFEMAKKISSPEKTFLVVPPFNYSFPAFTSRKVYGGHSLLTIAAAEKERRMNDFFFGVLEGRQMEDFLQKEKIDYLFTYPWTRNLGKISFLEKKYENSLLGIYQVKKGG